MSEIDYDRLAEAIDRRRYSPTVGGAGIDTTGDLNTALGKVTKSTNFIDQAFGNLGKGVSSTITQLNYGNQGLSALNGTIQGAGAAFSGFASLLKNPLFSGVLKGATDAITSYVQAVNIAADAQYTTYQALAKVGGADQFSGLKQVNEFANKLGYVGTRELAQFASMVTESSETLALFGGTVEGGLKQFADLSQAIRTSAVGTETMLMGFDKEAINKGLLGLIKNITAAGGSVANLGKTADQQAKSVQDYIKQQDIVTRLTGLSADAQQKAYEKSLANDRYALEQFQIQQALKKARAAPDADTAEGKARIRELTARQNFTQALPSFSKILGEEMTQGLMDIRSRAYGTDAAKKVFQSLSAETQALLQQNPKTAEEANNLQISILKGIQTDLGEKLESFGGNISQGATPFFLEKFE